MMWLISLLFVPCAQEDSLDSCYWDAQARGNHVGTSFVVITDTRVFLTRTGGTP